MVLGRLRWSPDEMWRATPREIAFALGSSVELPDRMAATDLQRMMDAFPDFRPVSSGARGACEHGDRDGPR